MKKYISAILVDALLIQFCGCYTLKTYTYDEFRVMDDVSEASVIYDTDKEVKLNTDSLAIDYTKWIADTDAIRIYTPQLSVPLYENESIKSDTIRIAKKQIKEVKMNEIDEVKTIIYVVGTVGFLVLAIGMAMKDLGSHLGSNFNLD